MTKFIKDPVTGRLSTANYKLPHEISNIKEELLKQKQILRDMIAGNIQFHEDPYSKKPEIDSWGIGKLIPGVAKRIEVPDLWKFSSIKVEPVGTSAELTVYKEEDYFIIMTNRPTDFTWSVTN